MSEVHMPRHRKPTTLETQGRLKLSLLTSFAMLDLSGEQTYRLLAAEMPDPGRRRNIEKVTVHVTNQMTPGR